MPRRPDESTVTERSRGSRDPSLPPETTGIPRPGELVDGRYSVVSPLGEGGMGTVYRARDLSLERDVALKLIAPTLACESAMVERFRREAAALARVRSDHVVQVYAFGPHGGTYFFAMEFVEGVTLHRIIAEHEMHGTHVPPTRTFTILQQIGLALADVHGAGVVHRDVKPANVVIEDDTGRPVLVDFGLALRREHEEGGFEALGGTPSYMAPEQASFDGSLGHVTPQTDLYALGCTAFELFTGKPPFVAKGFQAMRDAHRTAPIPRVSATRPELEAVDTVLARAMAKAPADRFPTALSFVEALEGARARWESSAGGPTHLRQVEDERDALRVLVVEDDDAFRRFAARAAELALYRSNVVVRAARSGVDALAMATTFMPHLLVLDYEMPGLNGVETLSRLRALSGGSDIRVLVISASVTEREKWRFSVLGVRECMPKPVGFKQLVQVLAQMAERAGWRTEAVAMRTLPPPRP